MSTSVSFLKKALNLGRTVIKGVKAAVQKVRFAGEELDQNVIEVDVRPDYRWQHKCPYCMKECSVYDHQSGEETWRAPNINGAPVLLKYSPARISCPEHGVVREYIPWADGKSRFTADFNNEVAWMAMQLPKTAIATYFQINWATVGNCIKAAHDRIEPNYLSRIDGLRRFCIDETSYPKGHKYITVVYDMDRRCVVWVHEGHGLGVFTEFCEQLTEEQRANILVVAGDGAKWIDTGALFFPNAVRCVDPFHVVGWVNDALDEVRIYVVQQAKLIYKQTEQKFLQNIEISEEAIEKAKAELEVAESCGDEERQKSLRHYITILERYKNCKDQKRRKNSRVLLSLLSPEQKETLVKLKALSKELKNARYAVGKNPENRTASQEEKLRVIEANSPELHAAYRLKEELRLILHLRDAEGAADELDRWIERARNSGLEPFVKLADKIARHRENILNSIKYQANSSQSESCNALIKSLIRIGKGFRNLANLTALILLKCSQIVIPLANRFQLTAEQRLERVNKAREYRLRREAQRRRDAQDGAEPTGNAAACP